MQALSRAADAVSDMELAGASIMGRWVNQTTTQMNHTLTLTLPNPVLSSHSHSHSHHTLPYPTPPSLPLTDLPCHRSLWLDSDQHWELLPATAMFAVRAGSLVQGFMPFPAFPGWLGKNSSRGKYKRLTQELVLHSSLAIGQGFGAVRLEYVPYWRKIMLRPLLSRGSEGAQDVIGMLDAYGLGKEDLMETMKEMQFLVDKDPLLVDLYAPLDAPVKSALTRLYNQGDHASQALVHAIVAAQGVKKKRGGGGGGDGDDIDMEGGTVEDLEAAQEDNEVMRG